jgi:hypothetical protein
MGKPIPERIRKQAGKMATTGSECINLLSARAMNTSKTLAVLVA